MKEISGIQTVILSGTDLEPINIWSGYYATMSVTPAAAAYSADDIIGTAQAMTWTDRNGEVFPGGVLWIVSTQLLVANAALESTEGAYTLRKFSAARATPLADNAAGAVAAADIAIYQDDTALGTPTDKGAIISIKQSGINEPIWVPATGLTYGELVTVAGFTATAVVRTVKLLAVPG